MTMPRSAPTIAAALGLGVLGDYLFRAPGQGINIALFVVLFVASGLALAWNRPSSNATPDRTRWPWVAAAFFASFWAVRDAELLLAVDLLAAGALMSLPLVQARGRALVTAGVITTLTAPILAARDTVRGAAAAWLSLPLGAPRRPAVVGAVLAAPLMLIFIGIFSSADPVFAATVTGVFDFDAGPPLSHAAVILVLASVCGGYFQAVTRTHPQAETGMAAVPFTVPVFGPLGGTALVFAAFLAVQAGSLFGGEAFVAARTGLTYAEYARGGFFQLLFAAALTLPLVYLAPFLAGSPGGGRRRALRALLQTQLGLTGLVLLSALWRMGLYISVYGLTADRLYGLAVMGWIAATLVVWSRTVVRDRPQRAAFGSLLAAVGVLAALNLANPQAIIARYNVSRTDRAPDLEHLVRLGGDAVPPLVTHLATLAPDQRCPLVRALRDRYAGDPPGDWRAWNLARSRARRAAQALDAPAGCEAALDAPPPPA